MDNSRVTVGICGLGFVGGAMAQSFTEKGYEPDRNLFTYDRYKNGGIGNFQNLLHTNILFLALPTPYNEKERRYEITALDETVEELAKAGYAGVVVIKSTVEPLTTETLYSKHQINLVHNPEFLTARTAYEDFHNQRHIVLGKCSGCSASSYNDLVEFYQNMYPNAEISQTTASESESMKIFVNCFYATKVQFFNELYLFSEKIGVNYDNVKDLMLKNGWINPMHTNVPGPDGRLSYGGLCFPKDTNALLCQMQKYGTPHDVLQTVIEERNKMRDDHANII